MKKYLSIAAISILQSLAPISLSAKQIHGLEKLYLVDPRPIQSIGDRQIELHE